MKTSPALFAAILLAALPRMSNADARAWRADLSTTEVRVERLRRGDTATLEARLYLRGAPYAPTNATCHYRSSLAATNWIPAACAVSSNVVSTVFSPLLEIDGDVVPVLFRVDGETYRAAAMVYLSDSPGADPPAGQPVLDISAYDIVNAPWATPACVSAAAVAATNYTDSVAAAAAVAATNYTDSVAAAAAVAATNYTAAAFARADEAQESAVVAGDEERQRADLLPLSADIVTCVRPTHDLTITYRVCVTGAVNSLVTPALLYRPGPEVVPPSVLPASFGSYTNSAPFSGSASATVDWTAAAPVVANTNAAAARPEIAEGLRGRFWIISSLPAPMTLDLGDGGEPLSLPAGTARREVSGRTGTTTVTLTGEADSVSLHICPVAVQELFWSWDLSDSLSDGWYAPFWMRWARPSSPAEYLFCARTVHLDATTNWTRSVTIAPNGERIEAYHAQPLPSDGTTELQPLGLYRFGHWGAGVGWAPGDGDELGGSIRDRRVWYRALGDAEIEALYIASGGSATNATAAADLIALARAADARRDAVAEARQYTDDMAEAAADYTDEALHALPAAPDITLGGTNLVGLLPEYIVAAETVRTNAYTASSRDTALRDGKFILLYMPAQPSAAWSLNLTLSDGSKTGAKPVRFWGTSGVTTQYAAGSILPLVYRAGAWYVSDRDTNSNDVDRNRINTYVRFSAQTTKYAICCGTTNGYRKVAPGVAFDAAMPILYANVNATSAAGAQNNNFYSAMPNVDVRNTVSGFASRRGKPLYLVGTLSDDGRTFTVGDPALSYEPTPPCIALGVFNNNADNQLYFLPGPLISGQTGGDASAVTNLVSDLLAEEVDALPVQSTLEVHRLVLSDLWDRVARIAGSSDADVIDDILLALDGLDARLTALEEAAAFNTARISEVAGLLSTLPSGALQVDGGGVASDRSAGEEALVRGDVAPTSD